MSLSDKAVEEDELLLDSVTILDEVINHQNSKTVSLAPRLFRSTDDSTARKLMDLFKNLYVAEYSGDNEHGLPRYDEFSMMARRTSFFLFDCPLFTAEVGCKTAFVTNGDHVFMHADFFTKLVKFEQETAVMKNGVVKRTEQNVDFILTHELGHASAGHHELFMTMPVEAKIDGALNAGEDTWMNLNYSPLFTLNKSLTGTFNKDLGIVVKGAYGLTEEEREFFKDKNTGGLISDVAIIRHYAQVLSDREKLKEALKKISDEQSKKNGQQPDSGAGQPGGEPQEGKGAGQPGGEPQDGKGTDQPGGEPQDGKGTDQPGGEPQDGKGTGQPGGEPQDGKDQPAKGSGDRPENIEDKIKKALDAVESAAKNASGDVHVVRTEDLAKALEKSGHGGFKDNILKLPDSKDVAAHKVMQDRAKADALTDHHQIKQLIKEYEERTGSKYAGGHIHNCMSELVRRRHVVPDSDLNLEDQILNSLIPGGQDMLFSEETPDDSFYLEPEDLGQEYRLNKGSDIYIKSEKSLLAIFDTSGSMTDSYISQVAASVLGIIEGDNPVNKVFLLHADTVARSGLIEINEDNASEILDALEVFGRGGTDLQNGICSAVAMAVEEDIYRQVAGILVLTDTYDAPPSTEQMEEIFDALTGYSDLPPIVYVVPQGIAVESFAMSVQSHGSVVVYNERNMELDLTDKAKYLTPIAGL